MKPSVHVVISVLAICLAGLSTIEGKRDRKEVMIRIPRDLEEGGRDRDRNHLDGEFAEYANDESCSNTCSKSEYIVLPPGYNKFKIPWRSANEPIIVEVTLDAKKVLDFDEIEEQVTLEMDIIFGWTDYKILDHRINNTFDGKPGKPVTQMTQAEINAKKRIINDPEVLKTIWKPNIFFEGLIALHQPYVMTRPVKLKVIPEAGYFQYATRVSVTVDCNMEFEYYPADTQKCEFVVRPYSYTSKLVSLKWHSFAVYLGDMSLPSFDVRIDDLHEKFIVDDWDDEKVGFEALAFTIFVRRQLSYHIVQTYLASTFYIIITCLCFLLPHQMVEARIGISMTTLLTLTAMFGSVRESTPLTSYVKAIDTWMVCCIFFVFLTLSQFTFYTWLRGIREKEDSNKTTDKNATEKSETQQELLPGDGEAMEMTDFKIKNGAKRSEKKPCLSRAIQKYEDMAFYIERFSFLIFLSIFAVYSILYWSWLITSSDYLNWTVNATMNRVEEDDD